ncbi:hypothetical protein TNCT_560211 [Trichonephila clavata]|uniref:Uncharacterized protein n=1 Tax=Trichonephila clavata TaxID=2740835 RepID=A0A8X6FJN5_TRICU|nr:hypothetical protein TNCT_560211 [Trichonephila clavata]
MENTPHKLKPFKVKKLGRRTYSSIYNSLENAVYSRALYNANFNPQHQLPPHDAKRPVARKQNEAKKRNKFPLKLKRSSATTVNVLFNCLLNN